MEIQLHALTARLAIPSVLQMTLFALTIQVVRLIAIIVLAWK
jgi:hypothetical protein